jgi:hypothetical protein
VPAATAVGDHRGLPRDDQVDRGPLDRHRLGAGRHRDLAGLTARPMAVRSFAVAPFLGAEVFAAPQRAQIAPRRIADEHDVAAVPAVAAIGPAARHVSFAPERDAPVAASTALDPDFRRVVHGGSATRRRER